MEVYAVRNSAKGVDELSLGEIKRLRSRSEFPMPVGFFVG
jgi:hypothetical protein